jgi:hypothetical protein
MGKVGARGRRIADGRGSGWEGEQVAEHGEMGLSTGVDL